jgi:hypothetical protein
VIVMAVKNLPSSGKSLKDLSDDTVGGASQSAVQPLATAPFGGNLDIVDRTTPLAQNPPTPPPRPANLGATIAARAVTPMTPPRPIARPVAQQPTIAQQPPMPPVRPQDLGGATPAAAGGPPIYSPLQVGNVRGGGMEPKYTSGDLGDILSRLFGRG